MKKNYFLKHCSKLMWQRLVCLFAFLMIFSYHSKSQVAYCTAANTDPSAAGSLMSNVTFGSINNSTGSTYPTNGYSYWPALTTSVIMGTSQNLTISIDPPSTYTGAIVSVWIDWNQDGTFATTEWLQVGTNMTNTGSPYTLSIPVPLTATPGTTRMRIRSRGTGNTNGASDACTSMGSGETEDYDISVVPATACSGTPTPGTAVVTPKNICFGQSVNLTLTGNTVASGLSYQWEFSTSKTGPWTSVGGSQIAPNLSHIPTSTGIVYYRNQVVCSNSSLSAASAIDSVVVPTPFPAGTYTINPSGSGPTNFTSISAAVAAISCGMTGPVIFNLSPNTKFTEQVTIPATLGTHAAKTVTFNGNGDTVTFAGTSSAPWTLGLNGADFITFNDVVFRGTNSTNALVVHLWNQADTNTFNNCTFLTNANVTSTTAVPFSISGSATSVSTTGPSGNGNLLSGCKLINGYDGAYLYGNSAGANINNRILNSTIRDFYRYGIYTYYQTGLVIAGDTLERPTRTSLTTFYGIYMTTGTTGALVEKNTIRNTHGGNLNNTGSAYGIYCLAAGTASSPNRFVNNLITRFNGRTSGSFYGIYLSGSYMRALHNTIAFVDTTTTTGSIYGLYASGTTGMLIRNNNVSIQQPGTGLKHAVYYSGSGKNSNFNNFHVSSPGGVNYIGYYSTTGVYAYSLAAWKTLGFDTSSVNEDPLFASVSGSNYAPTSGQLDDKGTGGTGIATDLLGNIRNSGTPDIGAYEFSASPCSGTPFAGNVGVASSVCANAPFSLTLTGFSSGLGINIQWEESPSGAGMFTPIAGATTSTFTVSGISSSTDYRAVVTCNNGGAFDVTSVETVSISPFYICYCAPATTSTTLHSSGYNYITNVNITGTSLNYTSPQSSGATIVGGYNQLWPINSTSNNSANLIQGIQYTLNATAAYTSYPVMAWMDYDGNGVFDTTEFIVLTPSSNGLNYSGSFIVPYSSTIGFTGLRFRVGYTPGYTAAQACFNYGSGYETEDYVVSISLAPGCNGMPGGGVAFAVDSTCPTVPLVLNDTSYTFGQGITYEWQTSPVGAGVWTAVPGATNPNSTIAAGILSPADFRLKTTCANGGLFAYSNQFTVNVRNPLQCYCTPTGATATYGIQSFSTTGGFTNISNLNSGLSSGGYGNFTNMALITMPGAAINFSASFNSGTNGFAVWVDWGKDGSFAQPGDLVSNTTSYSSSVSGSFNVPTGASLGTTRMRIISNFLNSNPSAEYCVANNNGTYAEWEDYSFTIATAPSCMPVSAVTAGNTLFNSATISWNQSSSGPSLGYYWRVVPQGSPVSASAVASGVEPSGDTTAVVSGLSASTSYTLWVRAVCSSSDSSYWASVTFTTPCSTAIAPFIETFNGTATPGCWTNSAAVPNGWMFGTGYSTPGYDVAGATEHTGVSGSTFAWVDGSYVTGNATATLTSPVIDVSALSNARLRYFVISHNPTYTTTSGNNRLIVQGWNGVTWVQLDSLQQSLPSGWNQRIASLSALGPVTTTQLKFIFKATASTAFYNDILLDDIFVESTPSCPAPTALVASNATSSSVSLNWTENGNATSWQVRYVPFGSSGAGTATSTITSKPFVLSGLSAGSYSVYVRSICGPGDTSVWSTAQLAATLPPNDSCVFAINITNGAMNNGYTIGATQSVPACDATPIANDVWYSFTTGSIGGSVTVTAITTLTDIVLQVFSGSCSGTLTPMVPTASSGPTLQSCIDGPAVGTEFGTYAVSANTTYYVRVYGYNSAQGTFTIQATGAPLPIKLYELSAANFGTRNRINWTTEIENRHEQFDLERSIDGINFDFLASVFSKGQPSAYTYWDESPAAGINYYRLKMIDQAGLVTYSKVVNASVKPVGAFLVEAYPNPVNDVLTVTVYNQGSVGDIKITDMSGRTVRSAVIDKGSVLIDLTGVATGLYLLKYEDNTNRQTIKIEKK